MANQSNDDLARALAGLSAGEHVEDAEHVEQDDIHAEPPAPVAPAPARQSSARPTPKSSVPSGGVTGGVTKPPVPRAPTSKAPVAVVPAARSASGAGAPRPASSSAPARTAPPSSPPRSAAPPTMRPPAPGGEQVGQQLGRSTGRSTVNFPTPQPQRPAGAPVPAAPRPNAPVSRLPAPPAPKPQRPSVPTIPRPAPTSATRPAPPQPPKAPPAAPVQQAAPSEEMVTDDESSYVEVGDDAGNITTAEGAEDFVRESAERVHVPTDADDTDAAVISPAPADGHASRAGAEHELTPEELDARHDEQADAMAHVVEDEDTLAMPAAPVEYLGHAPAGPKRKPLKLARNNSLEFRQTIVPVLLVVSLGFIVFGSLRFIVGEESPMAEFPLWTSLLAYGAAVVLLGITVMNMLFIRQELLTAQEASGA